MVEYNERPSDKGHSSSGLSNAATTEVKMELLPEGNSGREGPSGWMDLKAWFLAERCGTSRKTGRD
jgi:hypothetical protein